MWKARYVCSVTINRRDSSAKYGFCQFAHPNVVRMHINSFLTKGKNTKGEFLKNFLASFPCHDSKWGLTMLAPYSQYSQTKYGNIRFGLPTQMAFCHYFVVHRTFVVHSEHHRGEDYQ